MDVSRIENGLLDAPGGHRAPSWSSRIQSFSRGKLFYLPDAGSLLPRYGHGRPPHMGIVKLLEERVSEYEAVLTGIRELREPLSRIAIHEQGRERETDPFWANDWLPKLDAAVLYQIVASRRPSLYLEVGSGNSTLFASRAVRDHDLDCEIVSIDPHPRATCDEICDEVHRASAETVDFDVYRRLRSGDILFIDSSHRALMNSDVTTLFLDVIPELPAGVLVQLHDIWLPYDYPERWRHELYSEQYLLATWLLANPARQRIVFPAMYVSIHPELSRGLESLWQDLKIDFTAAHGASFWFETV